MSIRSEISAIAQLIRPLLDASHRARSIVGLLAISIAAVLNAAIPMIFASIIDQANDQLSASQSVVQALLWTAIGYAALTFFANLAAEVGPFFFGYVEQAVIRKLSLQLLDRLLSMDLHRHEGRTVGATGQILVSGINGIRMLFQHASYTVIPVAIEIITVVAIVFYLDRPALLIAFIATAASYLFIFTLSSYRIVRPAVGLTDASISANSVFSDALLNAEAVKTFSAERSMSSAYDEALARAERDWHAVFRIRLSTGAAVASVSAISIGTVMSLSLPALDNGGMTIGELVLVSTYMLRIAVPLQMVGVAVRDCTEALTYLKSMTKILTTIPAVDIAPTASMKAPDGPASIRFERVSFCYEAGRRVLSDVTLDIPPGTTIAVVGASGSGKSTLARLLLRICEPSSGRVLVDEQDTSKLNGQYLRSQIAMVPQDTILFNASVADNIALGREGASSSDVVEAVRVAGLESLIASLPDGLRTVVGERGLKLSGGERQRIAIARACIRDPRIIVLDEATSSLDSLTEEQVLRRLAEVKGGATTVIIAHRLATVSHADQIVVLHEGRVTEQGTHKELIKAKGAYERMWCTQGGAPQLSI